MWLHIHLVAFLVIAIAIGVKLMNSENEMKPLLMIIRLIYLVLVITGGRMIMWTFSSDPVLTVVKVLLGLGTIVASEMAFGTKGTKAMRNVLIGMVAATAVIGLILAGGRPFIS